MGECIHAQAAGIGARAAHTSAHAKVHEATLVTCGWCRLAPVASFQLPISALRSHVLFPLAVGVPYSQLKACFKALVPPAPYNSSTSSRVR